MFCIFQISSPENIASVNAVKIYEVHKALLNR